MSVWPNRLGDPHVRLYLKPADLTFDEAGTPVLYYGPHPEYGPCWVLAYLESDAPDAGVTEHFFTGGPSNVEWARRIAVERLTRLRQQAEDG